MATKTKKRQAKIVVNGEAKIIDLDNLTQFKTLFDSEIDEKLQQLKKEMIDMFVPVGSWMELYTDEIDPADIIPNTDWLPEDNGTVLRAAGNNSIVGSDSHQLTQNEMPQHWHILGLPYSDCGLVPGGTMFGGRPYVTGYPTESGLSGGTVEAGGSQSHSILQKSQNCYRYRRVARAA